MRRPDARPAATPASPLYFEIGAKLMPIVLETQKVTLAGFRILDPNGVVIAGRQEMGESLAHIEEVAAALKGQYHAALRIRKPDKTPPPIYSISRGVGVHVFSGDAGAGQQPCRRRDLHFADPKQHFRAPLS